MNSKIRLSRSLIGDQELRAVAAVFERAHLGMGQEVQCFESELKEFLQTAREVVCVATGTAALQLALQSCGIGPGDEVLVPTLTYVASFQAVSATGARPIPCDVERETLALDVADAERRVTPRTRAIMPVFYASQFEPLEAVYGLAQRHGLRVVEDAAHAFGCFRQGKPVGAEGDITCFSFDGIKNITCGEGGAIITSDLEVAERTRDLRLLGVRKDSAQRYKGERSWDFDVMEQGWRYHMNDIAGAIGRVQLQRFCTEFGPVRGSLARRYQRLLSGVNGIRCLRSCSDGIVPHIFPVFVAPEVRDSLRTRLLEAGIETGIHYKPNHLLTYYDIGESLPVSEWLYARMLTLPLHAALSESEQDRVVDAVKRHLT